MNLIMVIHCHQPVGNFDHVFNMAHERCYRPLLDLLKAYPGVRVGLHFSGPLLEWLEKNRPGTLDLMAALVKGGQVEPLSGGFFEPLLASIPARDARGQLLMMNRYLKDRFGFRPQGFWLTERVWDPWLPVTIAGTGMEYTVVDDTHFYYAGLRPHEIYGRYVTEKEGHTLGLFATPMTMRYIIPFRPVEEVMGHLHALEDAGHRVVLYGDDGEKFGLWPGTYEWVIEKGWLQRFFDAITSSREWLKTSLPGEYTASAPPLGRIYLPQASYDEMTQWALPVESGLTLEKIISSLKDQGQWDEWRPFVRGGIWDNFLVKYEEANRMHKKMLFLSERAGGDIRARDHLWRAQCNCAYWHGVFGGLYLGHLRRAVHENLIRTQALVMENQGKAPRLLNLDLDKDGNQEIMLWNRKLSLVLDPARGGGLFDLCHMDRALNLSDTLTRRPEAYHRQLDQAGEGSASDGDDVPSIHELPGGGGQGLAKLLILDRYTKSSLLDHFIRPDLPVEGYASGEYPELGDFVQGTYRVENSSVSSGKAIVQMSRMGRVEGSDLMVRKTVRLGEQGRLTFDYLFECRGKTPLSTRYGCEFNLTLYSDQDRERYYGIPETGGRREVAETGEEENLTRFELINGPDMLSLLFSFSAEVSVWFSPLMTVSKTEKGFERTYQGSSLLFLYPLYLSPGQQTGLGFELELRDL
ncbi:MAG: DUF1926 domain-containing protein [Deltaproteobacteria bacterium]|nr:DUF1926 domain-containing protein [Deltaproteobacteria bacterium]MBW2353633.1 DUF1926 domain-containing protein [Deltaproteobacteria bacterium]